MLRVAILMSLASCCLSAAAIYPVKVGERLTLDLGGNISKWGRTRQGEVKEYIRHCGPTEKHVQCAQFATDDGKKAEPASAAVVYENGTLVIDPVVASDAGGYFSPDEAERIRQNADGTYWATPRSLITVVIRE